MVEFISAVTVTISAEWFEEIKQYENFDCDAFLNNLKLQRLENDTLTGSYAEILAVLEKLKQILTELKQKRAGNNDVQPIVNVSVHVHENIDLDELVYVVEATCKPITSVKLTWSMEKRNCSIAGPTVDVNSVVGIIDELMDTCLNNRENALSNSTKINKHHDTVDHREKNELERATAGTGRNEIPGWNKGGPAEPLTNKVNDVHILEIPEFLDFDATVKVLMKSRSENTAFKLEPNENIRQCKISGNMADIEGVKNVFENFKNTCMSASEERFQNLENTVLETWAADSVLRHEIGEDFRVLNIPKFLDYDTAVKLIISTTTNSEVQLEFDEFKRICTILGQPIATEQIQKALEDMILSDTEHDHLQKAGLEHNTNETIQTKFNIHLSPEPNKQWNKSVFEKNKIIDSMDSIKDQNTKSKLNNLTVQANNTGCDIWPEMNVNIHPDHEIHNPGLDVKTDMHDIAKFAVIEDKEDRLVIGSTTLDLKVFVYKADIAQQKTDVIVNSTDVSLGTINIIMQTAGPDVRKECRGIVERSGLRPIGSAISTPAGWLGPIVKRIIHVVGPNNATVIQNREQARFYLFRAYSQSLICATSSIHQLPIKSISFPVIGANTRLGANGSSETAYAAIQEFDERWSKIQPQQRPLLKEIHLVSNSTSDIQSAIRTFRSLTLTGRQMEKSYDFQ